jgi:hypothetical protein
MVQKFVRPNLGNRGYSQVREPSIERSRSTTVSPKCTCRDIGFALLDIDVLGRMKLD